MTPLRSSPKPTIPSRAAYNLDTIPNRSTYSPSNTERFRPIFDIMLASEENQEILTSETGLKPSTLYIAANDARKWLAECHPTEREKWTAFYNRTRIRKTDRGILVFWRESLRVMQGHTITKDSLENVGWKNELAVWLTTAQSGDIFERRGVYVTDENRGWVINLMAEVGDSEVDCGTDYVRVMR